MGHVLYRKYRSKSLDEIIGQDHITSTLKNALKSGRISHAYLFTGPRGVGKTSVARILAHEINGIPYTDDSTHLDIIEIDAASNRRIDEIRELRDKVYVAPTSSKYKVYIIDEVHMLTREAFNALLKTLEEPPAHVVFILATTDAHKVPDTITSRTQRFTFKPVEKQLVIDHLADIAKSEAIDIDAPTLELIAEHGEGSFRDSISLLDQASSHGKKVRLEEVQSMLGMPAPQVLRDLLLAIDAHDAPASVQRLSQLFEQGFMGITIASELSGIIRARIIANESPNQQTDINLLESLLEVPKAHIPDRYLELGVLRAAAQGSTQSVHTPVAAKVSPAPLAIQPQPKVVTEAPKPAAAIVEPPKQSEPQAKALPAKPSSEITPSKNHATSSPTSTFDESAWPAILAELKSRHNTLYGVIRMAQPQFDDQGLTLKFGFAFHQKRVSEAKNQAALAAIVKQVTGQDVAIHCTVEKGATPPKLGANPVETPPIAPPSDIANISNIFGGAELLES